jgi:glyoxylase-like metal-dependent hydrolase (beta-lactamase superfamily II)
MTRMTEPPDHGWREVADHVFIRRYQPVDVTVTAIAGSDGIAVVDTRCSLAEGREIRDDLRRLTPSPVRWVVNTHAHWDHMWGNAEFVEPRLSPPAEIWGHANVPKACFGEDAATFRRDLSEREPAWAARFADFVEVPPDHLVESHRTLDLGDRGVELRHLGRGHTDGDLVLWLPDTGVLLAGDLVEHSGAPVFGDDSYPLEWPVTVDALLARAGDHPDLVVVPGHGEPVDAAFVASQRADLASVSAEIERLHAAGVPRAEAFAAGTWPFPWPDAGATGAVGRGYDALDGA